jgi:hypothetical protein
VSLQIILESDAAARQLASEQISRLTGGYHE